MDHTSTYLKRSKSVPIDVKAVGTRLFSPNDSALELVIPHLGRVRSMTIIPSRGTTLPATFKFRSPAPLLQNLVIGGFQQNHLSRLPRDFLGCHVPLLRSLVWNDTPIVPAPFPFPSFMLQPYAYELPVPLHAPLGLISSAPLLERVFLSINDGEIFPDLFPVDDIHLDSLRDLDLVAGTALSRALPHFKAPRLKQLTLLLTVDVGVLTIADLLPPDSYPLLTEVTSMLFSPGSEKSRMKLTSEDVEVTVIAHFPHADNFFSTTPFSLAQITSLMLDAMAKPITTRIREFTNLEFLNLQCCEEEAEVGTDIT